MTRKNDRRAALARAVGRAIAQRRRDRGLTQEQFSEAAGLAQASISQIERGVALPSLVRLDQLAELLGCRMAELIEDGGAGPCDRAARIHAKLARLTASQQEALESLLDEAIAVVTDTRQAARRRGRRAGA